MLTMLYSLYGLLMKRETLHGVNRLVLLMILVASMVLPLCQIETAEPNYVMEARQTVEYQIAHAQTALNGNEQSAAIAYTGNGAAVDKPAAHGGVSILILAAIGIYFVGLVISWARYFLPLAALVRLIRSGKRMEMAGVPEQVSVLVHPDIHTPCSWMKWVLLNPTDVGTRAIINHEMAHIRLRHSWDMLLCEFTCRMLWCVPFAWMLRQDLRDVHEYQADRSVLSGGINEEEYQLLLIRKATVTGLQPVVNALNQSPIKRRFKMMYTKPSRRWVALKATYLLPLTALALVSFARPQTMKDIERQVDKAETEAKQAVEKSGVIEKVTAMAENLGLTSADDVLPVMEQTVLSDSVVTSVNPIIALEGQRNLTDANLVKADLAESGRKIVRMTKSVTELLDSTMQAVGARKIAEGTYVGHFQPNLNSDTVRIAQATVLDCQSRVMGRQGFARNAASPYAYNITLSAETRKERTGYYIRLLQPVSSTLRHYDRKRVDPKMLSTDEVLVKDLYAGEYYPVAMERTKKDTRMYFFIRVPSKIDAASVEEGLSQYVSDFAIYDVATADKYVLRSMDREYLKLAKKDSGEGWSLYQFCLVFPPLRKNVDEVCYIHLGDKKRRYMSRFKLSEIPHKGRVITE